jgi:hypothetical protein
MARYIFHYPIEPNSEPFCLTCGRLAQAVADRFHVPGEGPHKPLAAAPPEVGPRGEAGPANLAPPAGAPPSIALALPAWPRDVGASPNEEARPIVAASGEDVARGPPALLERARALTRGPPAEAELANADLWDAVRCLQWALRADRLIEPRAAAVLVGDLVDDRVRRAFQRLVAALPAAHPALAKTDRRSLVQLVALGREFAIAAAEAPGLLAYVENELQPVDLLALLRV